MNETINKVSETYKKLAPVITSVGAILLFLLSYFIADKLAPLHQNISDLSVEVKQITAREQSNKNSFSKFETTISNGFTDIGNRLTKLEDRIDLVDGRLSRIEGKLE